MNLKDTYTYPVILDYSEEGFVNIGYPLFPELLPNCVKSGEEFISLAQDTLAMALMDRFDCGQSFPDESAEFSIQDGQRVVYVNLWMPYFCYEIKETYVKKTLTIPAWLNEVATMHNINFSATLTEALKQKLNFTRIPMKGRS